MATVVTAPRTSVSGDASVPADARVDHLIDAYRQRAFNLAYRLVRRPEDAADAVQDAFVLAMRATRGQRAALREPSRFGSWLLKIVANVALAQLRRRRAATNVSLDALGSDLADGRAEEPLSIVVQREQRGDVLQALLALPDAQRAALTLREYQGLSYDEIGELLDLDRGAIAALLYRARASFRAAYEGVATSPKSVGCARLAPLISAMLDAELESDTWKRVDQHVADCRRCRRELKQLRRGQRLHEIIPILTPPASLSAASALGAAGATGAAGVVGVMTKAPALGGLIGRAAELARPLVTGPWLGAAAALPAASDSGILAVVDRGIGKATGLAAAAGLVVVLAAGSPSHQRIADPASPSAPSAAEQVASASQGAPPALLATGASAHQGPVVAQPLAPVLAPAAPEQPMLASQPPAVTQIGPAAATLASADGHDTAPAIVGSSETPAGTSTGNGEAGSSSAPPPSVAQAGSPGAVGAPSAAGPASNEPPTDALSSAPPGGSSAAGGPGEPSAVSFGSSSSSGSSASIDLPSVNVAAAAPAVDLPPIDLSTVAAGRVELPAVDAPAVELPAVSLPASNRASRTLPAVDPPAVNLPPVELPVAEVPIAEQPLDRVRAVAGQALAAGEQHSKPPTGLADQLGQAIPGNVVAAPDVERTPASNTTSQRARSGHRASPGINVSGGDPAQAAAPASVTVTSGATGNGQAGSSPVNPSASAGAAVSNSLQSDNPSLTVHTGVDANGAVASGGATGLVESSVNLDAGSSSLNASIDVGFGSAGNNDSNSSSSVAVSIDTGSTSSNSSDNGSSSASVSVSASVDTGSVSASTNDSNTSVSVSVSVSVDTSNAASSVSVDTGSASVSVSVGGGNGSSNGSGSSRAP